MSSISIKFEGFWPSFDIEDNKFTAALRSRHDVTVMPGGRSKEEPDILFYSRCGNRTEHLGYNCIKVYFTGENDFPDFNECDYALSFYPFEFCGRHLRYPLYMLYEYDRLGTPAPSAQEALNRDFCSLVMSNSLNCDPERLRIIDTVAQYRPLAYGGAFRNNTGGRVDEKIPFIARYKFNLAPENSLVEGYVTEKLLEPLVAHTLPIYWGSDAGKTDFNPEAFINVLDFDSDTSLLQAIERLDNDPAAYMKMLTAPPLLADKETDFDGRLADFLDNIVKRHKKRTCPYGEQQTLHQRALRLAKVARSSLAMKILRHL